MRTYVYNNNNYSKIMKKLLLILLLFFLVSCKKEFKQLQRSDVIYNFINLTNDLDYKLVYFCDKYNAFEHFYDIKHTIFYEIGEHNYYKSAKTRMSIVSFTKDTGTCQFQNKTFYYLANKYNLNNANILNENHQIAVMVQAFNDGKQNLWYGYKKYKIKE